MAKTIITIGREYCTGGNYIAEDVANALGIKLYDKELITMAAKHSGLSEEAVAASEKRHTHSLLYSLYTMGNELPLGDQVFGQMHQGILVGGLGGHLLHQAGQQVLFLSHALRGRGTFGHQVRIADTFLDGDAQHDQQAQAQQQDDGAGGEGKTAISHAGSPSGADGHPDAAGHSP